MAPAEDTPSDRATAPYDQIVFSGGGLRCFWHGGWLQEAGTRWRFAPARVTGTSGGALSAAAFLANREAFLFERFSRALRRTDSNVTLEDATNDEDGRSPHQRVYEAIVEDVIDEDAQARIADGPAFQICVSTPGTSSAPTVRAVVGGAIYEAEQVVAPTPRPRLSAVVGLERRLIDGRKAARNGDLPELIRMAATVPPAFAPDKWGDEPIYDGGMVDKAPLPDPDEGRTLILLTKQFRALPEDAEGDRITYVSPGDEILSGGKLDFTDPALVKEAWDQGRRDGRAWLDSLD